MARGRLDDASASFEAAKRMQSLLVDRHVFSGERHSRIVILTSGTTGTPKGAPRKEAGIPAAVTFATKPRLAERMLRRAWRAGVSAA